MAGEVSRGGRTWTAENRGQTTGGAWKERERPRTHGVLLDHGTHEKREDQPEGLPAQERVITRGMPQRREAAGAGCDRGALPVLGTPLGGTREGNDGEWSWRCNAGDKGGWKTQQRSQAGDHRPRSIQTRPFESRQFRPVAFTSRAGHGILAPQYPQPRIGPAHSRRRHRTGTTKTHRGSRCLGTHRTSRASFARISGFFIAAVKGKGLNHLGA